MAPSRSATSSLPARVVNANPFVDCVRTIYGWFRRWLDLGLLDALLGQVARRRRREIGWDLDRPWASWGVVAPRPVKCIGVRGPRAGTMRPSVRSGASGWLWWTPRATSSRWPRSRP